MVCCVTLHNICVSSSLLKRPGTRKCTNAAILLLRQMYVPFHLPMQSLDFGGMKVLMKIILIPLITQNSYLDTIISSCYFKSVHIELHIELVKNSIYLLV